jgi:para-aminobenzoate synthetase/4-amino-4-deoxychorismate lyase
VAIRTVVLDTETRRAVFGVGGAVTYDSTPQEEYAECLTKARFLSFPAQEFQLIETLSLEDGVYFLEDRHVARMLESAAFFGFSLDEASLRGALEAYRALRPQGTWKVRLLASPHGEIRSEVSPLQSVREKYRVAFAPEPLDSSNCYLCHKTTQRSFYERPLGERPDCDDLIFWNERGEVTESSVANVVMEMDGKKWTPPRSSGLLGGTFREELLALGEIRERVILKDELKRAERLFLINSVRRWMRAEWIES